MVDHESRPRAGEAGRERRRFPRVHITGQIQGHVAPLNMLVTVVDMSLGGLCIQTLVGFEDGERLELCLTVDGVEPLNISARVIHSLRVDGPDGVANHLTGLGFVADETSDTRGAIERLMADSPDA